MSYENIKVVDVTAEEHNQQLFNRTKLVEPEMQFKHTDSSGIRSFHTMLKPSGAQCNLDCSYCFYLHKEDLFTQPKRPRMSDEVLEQHVRQYIEANTGEQVVFTWQGGEPTLMGLNFFKKVVILQKKYQKAGQAVYNDLQTNGTLLNDEWCEFLARHDFLVGLSIDGPESFHNRHRMTKNGNPSFHSVMKAVKLLHKHNVEFNALCVVNRDNAQYPLEVYRFIRDEVRPAIIQFIPAVEPNNFTDIAPGFWPEEAYPQVGFTGYQPGEPNSVVTDWSVPAKQWGVFLSTVWQEWIEKDFGAVFVDQFENIISIMFGRGAQKCVNAKQCGGAVALEHNGDIFSCDHFVYPEYKLGNIDDVHQADAVFSPQQVAFGTHKYQSLPKYCRECYFVEMCWGECPKNRLLKTPDGEKGLNYLCEGMKVFYSKALNSLPVLKDRLNL